MMWLYTAVRFAHPARKPITRPSVRATQMEAPGACAIARYIRVMKDAPISGSRPKRISVMWRTATFRHESMSPFLTCAISMPWMAVAVSDATPDHLRDRRLDTCRPDDTWLGQRDDELSAAIEEVAFALDESR